MTVVTTSWDDGDVLDERVAELLERYGLKGTFYIPQEYWGSRLSDEQILALSKKHEIGAHTLSHLDLSKATIDAAKKEIEGSKVWLEGLLNQPVTMFCYPRGRYTSEMCEVVKKSGYKGARTTELFSLSVGNPYEMATTVQVYPMPFRSGSGVRNILGPIQGRFAGFRSLHVPLTAMVSFEAVAKASFDEAMTKDGVYHLWGHSWEVEKYGLWQQLENVLKYISGRADCRYVTNGELV